MARVPRDHEARSPRHRGNVYLPSATPPAPSNDDFSVAWSPSPPTTTEDSTLTVNVLNANQWKCVDTAREALRENFAALAALGRWTFPASTCSTRLTSMRTRVPRR